MLQRQRNTTRGWTMPTPAVPILSMTVPTAMNSRRRLISFTQSPSSPAELAHQHGLAVGDPVLLLRVGGHLAEGERDLVERDPRRPERLAGLDQLLEPGQVHGVLGPEAADPGAAQLGEVGADAERGAEVVGEAAGVGPRGAGEPEAQAPPVLETADGSELVDGDLLGLGRHLLAAARQLVVLDALDLLGGVGGRLLLDLPLEAGAWPRATASR